MNTKPENIAETPLTEPSAPEADAAAAPPSSRETELETQLAAVKDQMLRALAESENTRRRLEREKDEGGKYAVAQFAKEMLQVADNLRRALDAIPAEAREAHAGLKNLFIGVEATERQMIGGLEKFGIKPMAPLGQVFDANFHQVMFEQESPEAPGTVLQVLQQGYMIADRLLRPALVAVAKPTSSSGGATTNTQA